MAAGGNAKIERIALPINKRESCRIKSPWQATDIDTCRNSSVCGPLLQRVHVQPRHRANACDGVSGVFDDAVTTRVFHWRLLRSLGFAGRRTLTLSHLCSCWLIPYHYMAIRQIKKVHSIVISGRRIKEESSPMGLVQIGHGSLSKCGAGSLFAKCSRPRLVVAPKLTTYSDPQMLNTPSSWGVLNAFVPSIGIEPIFRVPQTLVLSIERRGR